MPGEIRTRNLRFRRAALILLSFEHVRPEGFEPSSTALEVRLPSNRRGRVSTWGRTRTCGEMLNRHPRCRFATHVESPPPESNRVSAVYKTAASPAMLDGHARGLGARCDVDRDAPGRIRISIQQVKNLPLFVELRDTNETPRPPSMSTVRESNSPHRFGRPGPNRSDNGARDRGEESNP